MKPDEDLRFVSTTSGSTCSNTKVTADECKKLATSEKSDNLTFPVQVVTGMPGSGNDWILWLASISSKFVLEIIINLNEKKVKF